MILDAENVNKKFHNFYFQDIHVFVSLLFLRQNKTLRQVNYLWNIFWPKPGNSTVLIKITQKPNFLIFTATFTVKQYSRDQWTNFRRMLVNPTTSELASISLCIVLFLAKNWYQKYFHHSNLKSIWMRCVCFRVLHITHSSKPMCVKFLHHILFLAFKKNERQIRHYSLNFGCRQNFWELLIWSKRANNWEIMTFWQKYYE